MQTIYGNFGNSYEYSMSLFKINDHYLCNNMLYN